mgnify:CR=1 FL=1
MSFFEEFKKFAMRGNVIDLAVGVVIGGAFGKITSSLVDNIIMPPLSLLFGKVDFSGLFISLNGQHYDTLKAAQDAHAPILAYGLFINTIVNFLIIAFAIFVLIKQINRLRLQNRVYAPSAKLQSLTMRPVARTVLRNYKNNSFLCIKGASFRKRLFLFAKPAHSLYNV